MSTKQLGVSSAMEAPRAVCSALVFDAEVDVMSDFVLEERLNRFIGRFCFANFLFRVGFTLSAILSTELNPFRRYVK